MDRVAVALIFSNEPALFPRQPAIGQEDSLRAASSNSVSQTAPPDPARRTDVYACTGWLPFVGHECFDSHNETLKRALPVQLIYIRFSAFVFVDLAFERFNESTERVLKFDIR